MRISPASLGTTSATLKPDPYEYSWSWDLGKQAKANFDPGDDSDSMPYVEGGQDDNGHLSAITLGAESGWKYEMMGNPATGGSVPSGLFKKCHVGSNYDGSAGPEDSLYANSACSGDYGYSIGRIPAKALSAENIYISVVITFLPAPYNTPDTIAAWTAGNDITNMPFAFKIQTEGSSDIHTFRRPQYINGNPHWIWSGDDSDVAGEPLGTLSTISTREGRKNGGAGVDDGFNILSDRGKMLTLTYDVRTSEFYDAEDDIDKVSINPSDQMAGYQNNIGFIWHGIIIGSTVPNIRSLPIRTETGGEGRHSLKSFGPGS